MSFWSEKEVVARKAHRCDECGFGIEVGERYNKGAGINVEREFGAWISHLDCRAAALEYRQLARLGDDEWSDVSEWIWEMPPEAFPEFAKTYPGIFARFEAALREHGRLTPRNPQP